MDDLNAIMAKNIAELRTRAGMTQLQLAERLNYSDKLISKWERGDALPNTQTVKLLSEIFGVPIDYLFVLHTGEEETPITPNLGSGPQIRPWVVIAISIVGIWMFALWMFIIFWIFGQIHIVFFLAALPASLLTLLVLNSIWHKGRHNYWIIAALIASVILAVYFGLFSQNYWQLFLLLVPAELLVFLCAKLKK